ncbi:hypothetical protein [Aquisphaera insulae]|uniref:hypothetical protein n=1 Tax=Aquisphaera insulae TaxID=2712864 RepID=UPI0013EA3466|nr:hypothetical protein [Aquisphaera insulae]
MRLARGLLILILFPMIASQASADDPFAIRVVYAGNPGSDREKDFAAFLRQTFREVKTVDYRTFEPKMADGFDVVIFDWTSLYRTDASGKLDPNPPSLPNPAVPKLPDDYARPTILIGGAGQRVIKSRKLKIDWHCLCLFEAAHGLALGHEIFHTPLDVNPTFTAFPTPAQYPSLSLGEPIGATIRAWKVQTRTFPAIDAGLIAEGLTFADSPDAEVISAGLSSKGPDSAAIARQGNFLLWGFYAAPADLTPEARRCFLNAVCYIRKFEGQKPFVRKVETAFSRAWTLMLAQHVATAMDRDAYRRSNPALAAHSEERLEEQRRFDVVITGRAFPQAVSKQAESDPKAPAAWVRENYEWLMPGPDHDGIIEAAIDEDVKALGLSNHDVGLLEACVARLERGDQADRARRILERYTNDRFPDPKGWRSWLDAGRPRIFFTEAGGYKFLVAPEGLTPPRRFEQSPLTVPPPKPARVAARAECSPAKLRPGEEFTLTVRVEIKDGWHIAAMKGSRGPEVATSLAISMPFDVEPAGEWTGPEPIPGNEGRLTYTGTIEFRRRLRVGKNRYSGPLDGACTLGFQACDPFSCMPPAELDMAWHATFVER